MRSNSQYASPDIPSRSHLTTLPALILIPMATRSVTREQAERKKAQAAALMERIGEDDRASEFDDMSVDEYAEHRGLQIANPQRRERKTGMATKNELQDQLDSIADVVNEAYTPEASREVLAEALGDVLDIINGEDEDSSDDSSEDDEENGDDDSD